MFNPKGKAEALVKASIMEFRKSPEYEKVDRRGKKTEVDHAE